jgi:hypothetical protein
VLSVGAGSSSGSVSDSDCVSMEEMTISGVLVASVSELSGCGFPSCGSNGTFPSQGKTLMFCDEYSGGCGAGVTGELDFLVPNSPDPNGGDDFFDLNNADLNGGREGDGDSADPRCLVHFFGRRWMRLLGSAEVWIVTGTVA